jgi:hypothetical protein
MIVVCTALVGVAPGVARADAVPAATCGQTDVQRAVDAARAGDEVVIPAGTCDWAAAVAVRDKNVTIRGAGMDATRIRCRECMSVTSTASTSANSRWRVTGLTFQNAAPGGIVFTIWDNVGGGHTGWRIDHVRFDYPGAGSGYGIFVGGPTYGLIDHNEWRYGGGLAIIMAAQTSDEYPATGARPQGGWVLAQPLDLGTANALYIEDNTFTGTAPGGCAAYDT